MKLSDWLLTWWKHTELDEELQSLQNELQDKLTPMEPRTQFVSDLRLRLMDQFTTPDVDPQMSQQQALQTGLLVTGGILGSLIVVLAGIRSLVSFIGLVGLFISWIRQNPREHLTPSNLAHG